MLLSVHDNKYNLFQLFVSHLYHGVLCFPSTQKSNFAVNTVDWKFQINQLGVETSFII